MPATTNIARVSMYPVMHATTHTCTRLHKYILYTHTDTNTGRKVGFICIVKV